MPRVKRKANTGKVLANDQKGTKICSCCKKEKKYVDFYVSNSPLFAIDKRVPICKKCVQKLCLNDDKTINELEFNKTLRILDKPYYKDSIESAKQQFLSEHSYIKEEDVDKYGDKLLGLYFKNIMLRQDKDKSYSDSEKDGFIHQTSNVTKTEKQKIALRYADINNPERKLIKNEKEEKIINKNADEEFELTQNIIDLFGDGYTLSEYRKMNRKYENLKMNYTLQTNIHQEALATYVRFKVKEEDATSRGDVTEAKKWYDAAQDAAEKGKLTPRQLTKADLDSGVNSVSELTKAVEQAVDVIKILPRFKYKPNDAPDFNIWCYIDYERKLNDQPPVSYDEVYGFYDKKKREYIAQNGDPYGIFINDPTENNRESVKTFITLPDDYDELAGEDND